MFARGLHLEINLAHIRGNYEVIKAMAGNRPVTAVIKADAYGHGAVAVARELEKLKVHTFGVAYLSEAAELREAGIGTPLIVFFDEPDFDEIRHFKIIPVIFNEKRAKELSDQALKNNARVEVHLNIDTGMGRLGFLADRDLNKISEVSCLPGLKVTGLMSHFADADLADRSFAHYQIGLFKGLSALPELAKSNESAEPEKSPEESEEKQLCRHIANSAAVISLSSAHLDAVRPGLMLYGLNPCQDSTVEVKPAMAVKSRLLDVRKMPVGKSISYGRTFTTLRDSLIGVIAAGYADGYPRSLSNNGRVLVRGVFAPLVGRVCMDVAMVDLTEVKEARPGDEVVLLGRQAMNEIHANELAARAGTISYEILTTFGRINRKEYLFGS